MADTVFEPGKTYRIRKGWKAEVFATDGGGMRPIQGRHFEPSEDKWMLISWMTTGRCYPNHTDGFDLMPPAPPVVVSDAVLDVYLEALSAHLFGFHRSSPIHSVEESYRRSLAAAIAAYLAEQGGAS